MLKAFRYRLELTDEQVTLLSEWEGICRLVWNNALEQRREWLRRGRFINYSCKADSDVPNQAQQLVEAKKEPGLEFLKMVPSQVLQQVLKDLDTACRRHSVWKTRFKSKRNYRSLGLRFPTGKNMVVTKLNKNHSSLVLPKLGVVKFRSSRPVPGILRSATLVCERSRWFISILADTLTTPDNKHKNPHSIVGIDRGVKNAVVTSDNVFYDKPAVKPCELERYKRLQRQLARQKRGSANRRRTLHRMSVLRACEVNRRTSFINKTAHTLTREYATIVLEKLVTKNMTRSAKGTLELPGKNVAQKSGLNRAILVKGWYKLQNKLEQKSLEIGSTILYVDPKHTSQQCSMCGYISQENRESQAVFHCQQCHHTMHADHNAAINIRTRGQQAINRDCDGRSPAEIALVA